MTDPKGLPVDVAVVDKMDGTFTVEYTAAAPGVYEVSLLFLSFSGCRIRNVLITE